MGKSTGIAWCDSTFSSWWGCTKVAEATACADCYAEVVDKRTGESHWGLGAPRKLLSENARKAPYSWNRAADKFYAKHGRRQRVFTSSMGDVFDKEVPEEWRQNHYKTMEDCHLLEWQICTKRVTNLPKMVPASWCTSLGGHWPQHIGVLITVVTHKEALRDVPRLARIKEEWGIPWVGISYEPAMERIRWHEVDGADRLDWIIFGGESGAGWRTFEGLFDAARLTAEWCAFNGIAFFFKQVAAFRPTDTMIPADLMIRQFPDRRAA